MHQMPCQWESVLSIQKIRGKAWQKWGLSEKCLTDDQLPSTHGNHCPVCDSSCLLQKYSCSVPHCFEGVHKIYLKAISSVYVRIISTHIVYVHPMHVGFDSYTVDFSLVELMGSWLQFFQEIKQLCQKCPSIHPLQNWVHRCVAYILNTAKSPCVTRGHILYI